MVSKGRWLSNPGGTRETVWRQTLRFRASVQRKVATQQSFKRVPGPAFVADPGGNLWATQ